MLRRISLIAASVAMIAVSAVSASAATVQSSATPVTHKLVFAHTVHGIRAWGTYQRFPKFVRLHVCATDTARANFAVGAVAVGSDAKYKHSGNLGAVAIGYKQTVCRTGLVRYTAHLRTYTFIAGNKGKIVKRSGWKKIY
jgi:hypothetical protein